MSCMTHLRRSIGSTACGADATRVIAEDDHLLVDCRSCQASAHYAQTEPHFVLTGAALELLRFDPPRGGNANWIKGIPND